MDVPDRRLTPEEYRRLEALSDGRLEYLHGYAVALATPTRRHSTLVKNLVTLLSPAVRAHGCDYFAGDAKVESPAGDRAIPDFVVTCDDRDRAIPDDAENLVRHPCLIVEVLSPSTEALDRGEKLDIYATIPQLAHYVLIDSRRKNVTLFERGEDGSMRHRASVQRLVLPIAPGGISIDAMYDGVNVPDLR
jgi:Uma2 family endonuclease